ncbi:MAG: hypothetical protein L6V90_03785 [Treponema succinifaciens]|nr:MAG: hypothetical protein L6V90_03785 [Treponema succinifaciens]
MAAKAILENQNEIFIREFSVKLFNNSKRLEAIESSVRSLLYNYGEYDDKETVFEEHNIINSDLCDVKRKRNFKSRTEN